MNESKRTSQVLKRFRELYPDGIAWKFNDRIARSRPDAMVAAGHRVVFVEFKMPGNKPTPGQLLEMTKLRRAGFAVYVVWFEFGMARVEERDDQDPDDMVVLTVDELCHFLA